MSDETDPRRIDAWNAGGSRRSWTLTRTWSGTRQFVALLAADVEFHAPPGFPMGTCARAAMRCRRC